jgi:hypothetical protein
LADAGILMYDLVASVSVVWIFPKFRIPYNLSLFCRVLENCLTFITLLEISVYYNIIFYFPFFFQFLTLHQHHTLHASLGPSSQNYHDKMR